MATLKINGLSKAFGINTVFENVTFDVKSGERIGLVGANGAGKTTLLKCIMGTEEYDKGSVKASDGAIIGYLRQDFDYDSHTIREEMAHAWKDVLYYKDKIAEYAKLLEEGNPDEALIERYGKLEERFEFLGGYDYESKTRKILTGLGFKDEDWDRDIHSFSGGQKVRINLAAAFVRHPDFLLLDEPTAGMDAFARRQMWNLLKKLNQQKLTILLTTHYMEEAETLCDRVGFMCGGRLEETDAPGHMIETLGRYAVDETSPDGLKSHYFHGKEEAIQYLSASEQETALRSTTLEDVFLETIGQQLECR